MLFVDAVIDWISQSMSTTRMPKAIGLLRQAAGQLRGIPPDFPNRPQCVVIDKSCCQSSTFVDFIEHSQV